MLDDYPPEPCGEDFDEYGGLHGNGYVTLPNGRTLSLTDYAHDGRMDRKITMEAVMRAVRHGTTGTDTSGVPGREVKNQGNVRVVIDWSTNEIMNVIRLR